MFCSMAFSISVCLENLLDISVEQRLIDGVPQECVVIPIEKNCLRHTKRHIYLNLLMRERRPNAYRQTHYISLMVPNDKLKEYKELGLLDRLSLLGSAKMLFSTGNKIGRSIQGKSVDDILDGK